ncbi:MAG: hypothetical protein KBF57_02170 [Saprospiraceae bacterium]|nr:hypothetical protein [Saprospiraceae bacterium]
MPGFRYLLFDLDETLINFSDASRSAFDLFYAKYLANYGLDKKTFYSHYHDANMMVWECLSKAKYRLMN